MLASKLISITSLRGSLATNVARKTVSISVSRHFSNVEDPIVLTKDRSTFVAWHPEKPVPYECTKPMPAVITPEPQILKTNDCSAIMKKKHELEIIDELKKITYTTKHRWFPRASRHKKAKRQKPDREYL